MRIAFITESFPKLSETFILGKAAMLTRLGHRVTVFTQSRRPDVHPGLLDAIDLRRDVVHLPVWDRVRFRDLTRALAGAGPHPLRLARVAKAALAGPSPRGLTLVKSLPFARDEFDLIHAHYAYMGLRWLDVARTLDLPLVVSLLGSDTTVQMTAAPADYRPLFEQSDLFIASSQFLKNSAVAAGAGADADRIRVLPTEIDLEYFRPEPRPDRRPPVVLTVGRLHWTKGYIYGLDAMARLLRAGVDFRWRIVGEGDDGPELRYAVAELGLSDRVELVGARDRDGVREELRAADLFLLPSVNEGLGMAALEAQATGLPVVATRVGGLPEAVRDGETGLLVPSRDPAALADAVRRLLTDREERERMGRAGRQFVEKNFDSRRVMERLLEIYAETVRAHAGRKR